VVEYGSINSSCHQLCGRSRAYSKPREGEPGRQSYFLATPALGRSPPVRLLQELRVRLSRAHVAGTFDLPDARRRAVAMMSAIMGRAGIMTTAVRGYIAATGGSG